MSETELEEQFEPVAEEVVETPDAVIEEAPKVEGAEAVATEPVVEAPNMVPLTTLLDEREKRQALERKMQKPAVEPTPAPDFYDNPQAAVQHEIQPVQKQILQSKLDTSRFIAEREFGKEKVDEAFAYFNEHPDKSAELLNHPSPFHAAVEVYDREKAAKEIGDPVKYRETLKAEILAEIQAEQVTDELKPLKAAPSLANAASIGGRPAVPPTLTDLDDILGD